ncbi:hypothetical protein F4811DRAFT_515743 [Daldinia bambusicola]|nr:hypothetical protein F4811DRAFT_515743 [Daldinia bambusicola]
MLDLFFFFFFFSCPHSRSLCSDYLNTSICIDCGKCSMRAGMLACWRAGVTVNAICSELSIKESPPVLLYNTIGMVSTI